MPDFAWTVVVSLLLVMQTGCAVVPERNPLLKATLWWQISAEALAGDTQTYAAAKSALDHALSADPPRSAQVSPPSGFEGRPPAVVMDLDETVLDNSAYVGELIRRGMTDYSEPLWDGWVHQASARAVPGAIDFIHHAQARGVRAFFVTNRECRAGTTLTGDCPQQEDTARNLRSLGIQSTTLDEDLMLKHEQPGWGSEKQSRWDQIAKSYRIVLFIGDDLGDFLAGVKGDDITPQQRRELTHAYCSYWGDRWFLIANPMYGSWEQTLRKPLATYVRSETAPQTADPLDDCAAK
jgi:5'-nucleotidase (lipoprotein e(P4) family)